MFEKCMEGRKVIRMAPWLASSWDLAAVEMRSPKVSATRI